MGRVVLFARIGEIFDSAKFLLASIQYGARLRGIHVSDLALLQDCKVQRYTKTCPSIQNPNASRLNFATGSQPCDSQDSAEQWSCRFQWVADSSNPQFLKTACQSRADVVGHATHCRQKQCWQAALE